MSKYKVVVLFFLYSTSFFAQINQEKKPLIEIIDYLTKKYDYHFTYADKNIKNVFIKEFPKNLSLKEILSFLEKETGLIFQILKNNFIVIKSQIKSQFICGYIIDYETKNPIEAVTILGETNHTTTDSKGFFRLKIENNKEKITMGHLGYGKSVRPSTFFEDKKCSILFLLPQTETLSTVILKNFIAKGIHKVADGSYTINFSNFGILPGLVETDVLQTIQALPGVQSIDETISDINIRGGTNDQNLLLWDGIKMYQSGHFFGLISIFNPLITTDVSITKNGTSVDFTDGVSGTIAMKTSNNINKKFKGSIASNFINVDGFADIPLGDKSSLQVSARKAISDILETPTYTQYFKRILQNTEVNTIVDSEIKFDFSDTSLRWLYNITEKDKIRINFINVNNELLFGETGIFNQSTEIRENSLIQNTTAEGITYIRNWNSRFTTKLSVYETDYRLNSRNPDIPNQQLLQQENKVSETSIKLNTWYKYNDRLSFLNGYQFKETSVSNLTVLERLGITQLVQEVIIEQALYAQAHYISSSGKTNLKAGVRYNYIQKFNKHIIEPRLSFNYKLSNRISADFLGEYKHQNTSQIISLQSDFLGVEKRRWRLSNNTDIPIIKSKQGSVGLNYNYKGLLISTEGFYKEVEGITSQSQGFLNQYAFEKANGTYVIKGIDVLINKRMDRFSTWLSYSYADNEYTFLDFEEINFPNNLDITHSLNLGASYVTDRFKISVGFNWHTGKPTTRPIKGNEIINSTINFEEANASKIKDYLRIDLSAIHEFNLTKDTKFHVGVSIWNGLNTDNIINNYFTVNNNLPQEVSTNALGFTPNVIFRLFF